MRLAYSSRPRLHSIHPGVSAKNLGVIAPLPHFPFHLLLTLTQNYILNFPHPIVKGSPRQSYLTFDPVQ